MDKFPLNINPIHKDTFQKIRYENNLSILRQEIYNFILQGKEDDFFDFVIFDKKINKDMKTTKAMCEQIITELHELGWKTKLSYGNTGLFIYSSENPPSNAW